MSKRKTKTARYACAHCGTTAAPVKARTRAGNRCQACPDCRGLVTT